MGWTLSRKCAASGSSFAGFSLSAALPPVDQPPNRPTRHSAVTPALRHARRIKGSGVIDMAGRIPRDEKQRGKPVIKVNLSTIDVTDADLRELKEFEQLTSIDLAKTKGTDAGLKELKELKELSNLDLSETQITDASLRELTE